jgi:hypothetical protein
VPESMTSDRAGRSSGMAKKFTGEIELDIRKSKPDWDFFLDKKAPKDARCSHAVLLIQ